MNGRQNEREGGAELKENRKKNERPKSKQEQKGRENKINKKRQNYNIVLGYKPFFPQCQSPRCVNCRHCPVKGED